MGDPEGRVESPALTGIHKIQHVVIIMQENRSFDSYFGTYPGADGIPAGTCIPDPQYGGCVQPYHNTSDVNYGAPHGNVNSIADVNDGLMDGFVGQSETGALCNGTDPTCSPCKAKFVLQDHMFASIPSSSQPAHLMMVSGWSAFCTRPKDPASCVSAIQHPYSVAGLSPGDTTPLYAWTDLTYLLHKNNVPWAY